jgi:PAS domain S-box-containing protein
MTNTIAMETPDNPPGLIATLISDYWPYAASVGTVILSGTTWGYVKFARRKGISVLGWFRAAVAAPMAIAQLRANMVDRAEFDGLNAKVQDMRTMMVRETATRRALLQHSDTAFFEADKNGRVVWVNTAYLTMVDRELHEVTENNWRNSIHSADRTEAVDEWRRCVTDCTDYRCKFRVIASDNSDFWVAAEALCTKDDLGNVLSFAGALRKIADPRR